MTTLRRLRPLAASVALCLAGGAASANPHPWWWWFGADGKTDEVRLVGDWRFDSGNWQTDYLQVGRDVGGAGGVYPGDGTLDQDGGSFTVGLMRVGHSMSTGHYTVHSGQLSVDEVYVGGGVWGQFRQEAGTVSFGSLLIGSTGCCRGITGSLVELVGGVRTLDQTTVGTYSVLRHDGGSTFGTHLTVYLGTLQMNGGVMQMSQGIDLLSHEVRGGIVRPHMTFAGGVIQGDELSSEGYITWTGGNLIGLLNNRDGAELAVDGAGMFASQLNNEGLASFTSRARLELGPRGSKNSTTGHMSFAAGSLLQLQGDLRNHGTLRGALAINGSGSLQNEGSVLGGVGAELRLDAAQVVNLAGGLIALDANRVRGSNTVVNDSGARITSQGHTRLEPALNNRGRLELGAGLFTASGGIDNRGEMLLLHADVRVDAAALRNDGTLRGQGTLDRPLTNNGVVRAEGGTLQLRSPLTLQSGSRLQAGPGATLLLAGGLPLNPYRITLEGGTLQAVGDLLNTGRIEGQGTLVARELVHQGQMQWSGAGQVQARARIEGRVDADAGARVDWLGPVALSAAARLAPAAGARLHFAQAVTWLAGAQGVGAGDLSFAAALALGSTSTPATVTHAGGLQLLDGASLQLDLGASGASDRLVIGGALALGGKLQLSLAQGVAATQGERYTLLGWGGPISGTFGVLDTSGAALDAGLVWDWSRLYVDGTVGIAAVPEPGSLGLMAMGLAALLWGGRRRGRVAG